MLGLLLFSLQAAGVACKKATLRTAESWERLKSTLHALPNHERAAIWERLMVTLETLPDRWRSLPRPCVKPSGRSWEEITALASKSEQSAALQLISTTMQTPPAEREQRLAGLWQQRHWTEYDLWLAGDAIEVLQTQDFDATGRIAEAWLSLAAHCGRRDILLFAAGTGFYLSSLRVPPERRLAATGRWLTLPRPQHSIRGSASLYRVYARTAFMLGKNKLAILAYQRSRLFFKNVGDKLGQGASWHGEADVQFRLGANEAALTAYRQARGLFISAGSMQGEGNSWIGEASVQFFLGANEVALTAYRQARRLFIHTGDKQGEGNSWIGEANIQFRLGANQASLNAYRQARRLFVRTGSKLGQGNSWDGEADVQFRLGANEAALNAYRQARRLFVRTGSKLGQGNSWNGEASVQFRLGAHTAALNAYRQARRLFVNTGDKLGRGNSWLGEADVYFRLGAHKAALNSYRQARSLFRATGDKQGQGYSWIGEAGVQFRLGANEAALNAYTRAHHLFMDTGSRLGQSNAWIGVAKVQLRLGYYFTAQSAADKAIAFAEHNKVVLNEFVARMRRADILLTAGREAEAIAEAERARIVLRRVRQQNLTEKARTSILDTAQPYDLLVTRLLRRSGDRARSVERALALAEEAHAPILLDILTTGVRNFNSAIRSEDIVRLERRREQLEREIARAEVVIGQRHPLRDKLSVVDAKLENERMVQVSRQNTSLANATILTFEARKQLVYAIGPVLLYYVAPDETVLFLLRPGRAPVVYRIPLSRTELQREVNKLRRDLANSYYHRRARAVLQELFTQLIGPVVAQLSDTDRLTIIPHGPLHELPFESLLLGAMSGRSALAAGDQASQPSQRQEQRSRKNPLNHLPTLGDRWHVTIAPSLSALHTVRERKHKRDREARHRRARGAKPDDRIPFLGIASGKNLDTAPEVRQAGTLFGPASKLSLRTDGSRDTYRNYAGRAAHILLSTHGTHVAQSRFGYLDLTAKEGHAVRLTASEIATRPLVAELVTLAACETARGIAMLSDERLDLSRAFLIAGADAILATRWRVPDGDDTRQFVVDFYTALLRGGPNGTRMRKDEALTRARQLSRQRGDTAKLWAAWVLIGDGR